MGSDGSFSGLYLSQNRTRLRPDKANLVGHDSLRRLLEFHERQEPVAVEIRHSQLHVGQSGVWN